MYFIYDGNAAKLTKNYTDGHEVGKVKWRNTPYQVTLISKVSFSRSTKINKIENEFFNILKSNLQKQIRRKDIHAIATCEAMLEMNPFDTLRRLVVIAAEDVEISKETSTIVWLMSAVSKNYVLTKGDINFVLKYLFNLVNHNVIPYFHTDEEKQITVDEILNSEHSDKEYIAGIFFRTAYGGMPGDMRMMNQVCGTSLTNKLRSFGIGMIIKTDLKICDAAIDFHVYPSLCDEIFCDTGLDPDLVKELIWNCSSKLNKRLPSEPIDERWNLIKNSFEIRSKEYLQKVLFKI